MKIVDFVSCVIIAPAVLYGTVTVFLLCGCFIYFIFRKATIEDLKDTIKGLRLGDSFIAETKKLFWFTYTPLFIIVIIFRFSLPLYAGKNNGFVFAIVCYLLMLLFSGYVSLKKNKE